MKSKMFLLNAKDFIKGAIVAILTGIGTLLSTEMQTGTSEHLLNKVLLASLISFIAYLVKNLLTTNDDKFLNKL